LTFGEPGMVANSPTVDGAVIPNHPWDPSGPALSANIPLLIGYARTEETLYDRPTPETLALDEAGLRARAEKRLGMNPERVIEAWVAFARTGNPNTSGLPKWPAYSTTARDTMLFNNASRVEQDPDREPRLVMEQLLKLT